jgi:nucleoside-diphosphate-sugar epimerase
MKPGHVFNRIHVDDIAATVMAAIDRRFDGVVNVTDNEPAPASEDTAFAARLLGREPPPEVPFDTAAKEMSPMAMSFWSEHRRVSNARLKRELGVTLAYPTYREGLSALHAAGEGG